MSFNTNKLVIAVSLVLSGFFAFELYTQLPAEEKLAAPVNSQQVSNSKILFGSSADQNAPQPIWTAINREAPDVFLFLGDNIYRDTESSEDFQQEYGKLSAKQGFQTLRKNTDIVATWNDHDYGVIDGGVDYPAKELSRQVMLDFWEEPKDSQRRSRDWGIYKTSYLGTEDQRVQIIMLDTRWNRTPLIALVKDEYRAKRGIFNKGFFVPSEDPQATILGEQQWQRLEQDLKQPADLRIIASSIQVFSYFTGFESWANFPREQTRLLELIKTTEANNILFISGDTGWGELSKVTDKSGNSLFELTSSGLTHVVEKPSSNQNRVQGPYSGQNYGFIEIDWQAPGRPVLFGVRDVEGRTQFSQQMFIDDN